VSARAPRALAILALAALLPACSSLFPTEEAEPLPESGLAAPAEAETAALASRSTALERRKRLGIDLAQALELAGARPTEVQKARVGAEEARVTVNRAEFSVLPTFFPFFRPFYHMGKAQPQTGINVDLDRTNYELQLMGAAFFDPGPSIFATLAAKRRVAAAEAHTETARLDAVARAARGYFALAGAYARATVALAAVEATSELLRDEETRERLGAGIRARVLSARAELALDRQALAAATGEISRASAALVEVLQLETDVELVPREKSPPLVTLFTPGAPVPDLVNQALEKRPELHEMAEEIAARERLREGATYGSLVPFLSAGNAPLFLSLAPAFNFPHGPKSEDEIEHAQGAQSYYYPLVAYTKAWLGGLMYGPLLPFPGLFMQSGVFGPELDHMRYSHDVMLAVGLNVGPLGIGDLPRIQRSRLELQKGFVEDEALRAKIQRQVADAAAELAASRERLDAARDAVESATESARLSSDRLAKGVAIQLEVLEAQRALTRAREREVDARVAYDDAEYDLFRATGTSP
jgi:outer membrane protein TolC